MTTSNSLRIALLRRDQVQAQTGLARSTLYKLIGEGTFPPPYRITTRTVGWKSDQVDSWVASRKSTKA